MLRRNRTPLLIGLAVLLTLVALSVASRDNARFGGALDPRNPGRDGAQAVAKVLDGRGVTVRIVRGQAAFESARVDADTTIVVTNPGSLGASTLRALRERAAGAGALVLAGGPPVVTDSFGLRLRELGADDLPADCRDPLVAGLTIHAPYPLAVVGPGCFGNGGAAVLHRSGQRAWLLTAPEVLSNRDVLDADNAALALRLLGQHDSLVWYVADASDTTADDAVTVSSLLPDWLVPTLWTGALSLVALVLWRGRRLGPLVREPIPVVIRAAEATRSRGRLYHRARDREHAAVILRRATRHRLGEWLALPSDAPWYLVADAAAARAGRPVDEVRSLLGETSVPDDSRLADLGRQLLRLEDEVRTP